MSESTWTQSEQESPPVLNEAEATAGAATTGAAKAGALAVGALAVGCLFALGFWLGTRVSEPSPTPRGPSAWPTELLQATATHGSSTMAVCTAMIDEESDGFFALDFLTGDLKGWVINPRTGAFGGLFATNVSQMLGPPSKNAEYLLVSGRTQPPASGTTTRAASMVLYVVDVRAGQFVALSVPWDRSMRNSGAPQASSFIPYGGDMIRPPVGPGVGGRKPPAANPNEPKAPANKANPPNNNPDKNNN